MSPATAIFPESTRGLSNVGSFSNEYHMDSHRVSSYIKMVTNSTTHLETILKIVLAPVVSQVALLQKRQG
jgi:hypothetical protein